MLIKYNLAPEQKSKDFEQTIADMQFVFANKGVLQLFISFQRIVSTNAIPLPV